MIEDISRSGRAALSLQGEVFCGRFVEEPCREPHALKFNNAKNSWCRTVKPIN